MNGTPNQARFVAAQRLHDRGGNDRRGAYGHHHQRARVRTRVDGNALAQRSHIGGGRRLRLPLTAQI